VANRSLSEPRNRYLLLAFGGILLATILVLAFSQNTALFSLLGTMYGGNGTTTFALPNLQSRMPIGFGQAQGGPSYAAGAVPLVPSPDLRGNFAWWSRPASRPAWDGWDGPRRLNVFKPWFPTLAERRVVER